MRRYKIIHRTYYNFSGTVVLGPHTMRLRPREDHELRIESSLLNISPTAKLSWHRDVEDNSVVTSTFNTPTNKLAIESEVVIQQYNLAPFDFLVADYALPITRQTIHSPTYKRIGTYLLPIQCSPSSRRVMR